MRIELVRHGMTEANEKKLYCGSTDLPLSENGIKYLHGIKNEAIIIQADMYISSSLKRSIQTMEILYEKTPHKLMPEFNEMNFGEFEMKSYEDLKNDDDYLQWITKIDTLKCPNGESLKIFKERVICGFEKVLKFHVDSIVIVCHGGVIVTIMDKLFPNIRNFYKWQPEYGKGYNLKIDKGDNISWQNL